MVVGNRCWICFTLSEKNCFVSDFSLKMCIKSEKKVREQNVLSRYKNMILGLYFDKASCKGQIVTKEKDNEAGNSNMTFIGKRQQVSWLL